MVYNIILVWKIGVGYWFNYLKVKCGIIIEGFIINKNVLFYK